MAQGRITDKQKEILEFIKACILKKGYPPTVREICEKVQLKSTSSVHSPGSDETESHRDR